METTYTKDGFTFFRTIKRPDEILGDRLIIDPGKINKICDYIQLHHIKAITINPYYYKVNDLEFLKDIDCIEGLYLLQNDLDTTSISYLKKLRVLRLDEVNTTLDFENFPDLEVLGVTHSKYTINISSCKKLFWLWLDKFKLTNLEQLTGLISLKFLYLYTTAIVNLEGINYLSMLKEIHIDAASKLRSLDGISESNQNLEVIDIYNAKSLQDYSAIKHAKSINKIRFAKTGEIESLSFLKELPNIKSAYMSMKVLDGDMSYVPRG